MGLTHPPTSVGSAVECYLQLRSAWETRLGVVVDPRVGHHVAAVVTAVCGEGNG